MSKSHDPLRLSGPHLYLVLEGLRVHQRVEGLGFRALGLEGSGL